MSINDRTMCKYVGRTPLDNSMCLNCELFLNTCSPVASDDGYAGGSECGCYLCEGCDEYDCMYKNQEELWG